MTRKLASPSTNTGAQFAVARAGSLHLTSLNPVGRRELWLVPAP